MPREYLNDPKMSRGQFYIPKYLVYYMLRRYLPPTS
jgi:hypothetical protein